MSGFRVSPTHSLLGLTPILFELFDPLLPPFSRSAFQFLQPFFLIGVQPFQYAPGLSGSSTSSSEAWRHWPSHGWNPFLPVVHWPVFGDALLHDLLKQTPEDLAKAWLPPPKLRNRAVIRHPVKQIQPQIPPQRHISLNSLLNLTLGGYAVQKAHQQIFHQHHRVDGRPPIPLAI